MDLRDVLRKIEVKVDDFASNARTLIAAGGSIPKEKIDQFDRSILTVFGSKLARPIDQAGKHGLRVSIVLAASRSGYYSDVTDLERVLAIQAEITNIRMDVDDPNY